MTRGIIKNLTWLTFGNVVTKPVWLWFTVVLLAGSLGEAGYGVLNAALALMLVASGVTSLGAGQYIVREVARNRERASAFFSNFILLQLGTVAVVFLAATAIGVKIGYQDDKLTALLLAGVYAMCMALTLLCRAFYRAFEQMQWVSISLMVEKALVIVVGTWFVLSRPSVTSALAGMATGMAVTLVGNVWFVRRRLARFEPSSVKLDFLKKHLSRAVPLGLIGFFTAIYFRTDQVMVEAIAGEAANGQYSMAYRLIEAALILPLLMTEVLFPRLSNLYGLGEGGAFKKLMKSSLPSAVVFGLVAAAAIFILADPILDVVRFLAGSSGYSGASRPLKLLAWTLPFMSVNGLLCIVMTARDDQNVLAVGFGVAALINVAMNLVLIPRMGPEGAAVATLLTEAVVTVGLVSRYRVKTRHIEVNS